MLSCEFCEISKKAFFTEHLQWLLLQMTNQMMYIHESYSSLYPVITKNHLDICERLFLYILYKKRPFADVLQIKCSLKFHNIHRKTPVLENLKETPTWAFSWEYCKIFKNNFFAQHIWWLLLIVLLLFFFEIILWSEIILRQWIRTPFKSHRILTEYL